MVEVSSLICQNELVEERAIEIDILKKRMNEIEKQCRDLKTVKEELLLAKAHSDEIEELLLQLKTQNESLRQSKQITVETNYVKNVNKTQTGSKREESFSHSLKGGSNENALRQLVTNLRMENLQLRMPDSLDHWLHKPLLQSAKKPQKNEDTFYIYENALMVALKTPCY